MSSSSASPAVPPVQETVASLANQATELLESYTSDPSDQQTFIPRSRQLIKEADEKGVFDLGLTGADPADEGVMAFVLSLLAETLGHVDDEKATLEGRGHAEEMMYTYAFSFNILNRSPTAYEQFTAQRNNATLEDLTSPRQVSAMNWARMTGAYCNIASRDVSARVRESLEATASETTPLSAVERFMVCYALSCAQQFHGVPSTNKPMRNTIFFSDDPRMKEMVRLNRIMLDLVPEVQQLAVPEVTKALPHFIRCAQKAMVMAPLVDYHNKLK